jgi:hypothetical protein
MTAEQLLPRSAPSAEGVDGRSVLALLDRLRARSVECHSVMVARHGRVVAEGWWAPHTAGRAHLLYSLTKSFVSVAAGFAVAGDAAFTIDVGHGTYRESAPLGRPVVAAGGWRGDEFAADICVITSPSRVRLRVNGSRAGARWNMVPLTGPDLVRQLRSPLMTRPDVA